MSFFETFNLAKVKGVDIDTGSGPVSAATIRVILATDQGTLPVSVASLPLPTGAATSAKQDTIIGHVDGIEALLGTIDADTSNISTKIDTIAGAVAGTEMQVDVLTMPTVAVTGTFWQATQPVSGSVTVSSITVQKSEDQASGGGDTGAMVLFRRSDTPGNTSDTDGDYETPQMSAGRLWTSSVITGTVAVTQSGTWDEVGINDSGNSLTVDAPVGTPVFVRLSDGASAITTLPVSLASVPSHAVTNAGTFAVQVDGNALTALQLIDDPVIADDAGFTVGSSKVMMSGHQAVAMGSNPDAADALDAVVGIANRHRVPYMIGGHPNIVNKHIQVTDADGAQTDTALVTVGAGAKIVVTRYSVTVDSATTATGGVAVRMGFGTANTPSNDANSGVLMAHSGIPAGGGIAEGNGGGIIGMGADNEDLRLTCEDPAGGNIDIVVSYYTIES